MTVTYTADVATSSKGLGCFWKLLFRWKGSIYKLVWHELVIYCILYTAVSLVYRLALSEGQKRVFEGVALHVEQFSNLIPMAFVLGFYVSIVIDRWWNQYSTLPWPNTIAVFVSISITGQNEEARVLRRTIMRYVNLSLAVTLSMISPCVKKRFPTLDHLVKSGLLTEQEQMIFEIVNVKTKTPKYWLPLVWAGAVVTKARKQGSIKDDLALNTIMNEITNFRRSCHTLFHYDYVCIPLVYTQVVTLAVYTFFFSTVIGRQFLEPSQGISGHSVDFYVPWFTILQFFFYMGWLKVAESLINPFGDDDDDFDVENMVEKNLQASYLIVDEMHEDHPEPIKDMYYDEKVPAGLPYTRASEQFITKPHQGSTAEIALTEDMKKIVQPVIEEVDEGKVPTVVGGISLEKVPSNLEKLPDIAEKVPDIAEKVPDIAEKVSDKGEKAPDNAEKVPDNAEKVESETQEEEVMYRRSSDASESDFSINGGKRRNIFSRIARTIATHRIFRGSNCSIHNVCSRRCGARKSGRRGVATEMINRSSTELQDLRDDGSAKSGSARTSYKSWAGGSGGSSRKGLPQVD